MMYHQHQSESSPLDEDTIAEAFLGGLGGGGSDFGDAPTAAAERQERQVKRSYAAPPRLNLKQVHAGEGDTPEDEHDIHLDGEPQSPPQTSSI